MGAILTHSARQETLDRAHEAESDLFLVQMVRVQRVIETIHSTDSPSAPTHLYVKAYQADVERLRRTDRCPDENIFLHMQYLIADMHIAELALADLAEHKGASLSSRLDDLHRCVEALKALCKSTPCQHVGTLQLWCLLCSIFLTY